MAQLAGHLFDIGDDTSYKAYIMLYGLTYRMIPSATPSFNPFAREIPGQSGGASAVSGSNTGEVYRWVRQLPDI